MVAFQRDYSGGRLPSCPVERLGCLDHGRYLSRLTRLLRAIPQVRSAIRRNDMVYAFNPDMAALALVAGIGLNRPVVVEVADIREIQTAKGLIGRLVRTVDRFVTRACRLLVLTTRGYLTYYREWLKVATPDLIIENKLDPTFVSSVIGSGRLDRQNLPLRDRPLRIGYFGRLRDEWSLQVLEALARSASDRYAIILAGNPPRFIEDFSRRIHSIPNMEYRGSYGYPEDLPALYEIVDMVWGGKPPDIPNSWSQTNRYYEACLFQKPLIVRSGTGDGDEVMRHNVGLTLTGTEVQDAVDQVNGISSTDWRHWQTNMASLPVSVFSADGDAEALRCALNQVIRVEENRS